MAFAFRKQGFDQQPTEIHPLTAEVLKQLLRYDPETGQLFWLERPPEFFKSAIAWSAFNTFRAGNEAFTATRADGYRVGAIFGKLYRAHRVIWALHFGHWPVNEIDHIDGNPGNNRLDNLRDVPAATNRRNSKMLRNNTSGHTGVTWSKMYKKWVAHIKLNGRYHGLGYFTEIEAAIAARKKAETGHGFTERHGMEAPL